jgi:hypothetical protein
LLLVQQPMHRHAVQHHHDRIRDLWGPAFLDTGGTRWTVYRSTSTLCASAVTRSIQPRPVAAAVMNPVIGSLLVRAVEKRGDFRI